MDPGLGGIKRLQIEAVVIRANGQREDLGVISDSKWGRFSVGRWLAARRTRKSNSSGER